MAKEGMWHIQKSVYKKNIDATVRGIAPSFCVVFSHSVFAEQSESLRVVGRSTTRRVELFHLPFLLLHAAFPLLLLEGQGIIL